MESDILVGIGSIVVLGVGLQWLAGLIRFPSIILLLAGGLLVGPWLGWVDSDKILGSALFPFVSLAVGILLFIGGLELRLGELGTAVRRPVSALVSLGVLITWLLTSIAAHVLFGGPVRVSLLLGAILVVSGPTVVIPLLRLSRPDGPVATILTWEGIVIDPIGATLSLFCFSAFFIDRFAIGDVWGEFVVVALSGVAVGMVAAGLLVAALRRLLVPANLEVAVAIMFVVAAYVVAESVRPEAGLFATTTMGIVLANQRLVGIRQLRLFGDPIVSLLIGSLFIVLASRVEPGAIMDVLPETLVLVAFLTLIVRPLVVLTCTAGTPSLTTRQWAFIAAMAPRGIIAASTAAFYSLRLGQMRQASEILVPVTFAVIILLSLIYGLGAIPAARLLKVQRPTPHGVLVVSPEPWAIAFARELCRAQVPTVLVARGRWDLAEDHGLPFPVYADLIRGLPDTVLLANTRDAVVASPDDEANLIAVAVLTEALGRDHVYLLSSEASRRRDRRDPNVEAWTRRPFSSPASLEALQRITGDGVEVRTVSASSVRPDAVIMAEVRADGSWTVRPGEPPAPDARLIIAEPPPAEESGGRRAVMDDGLQS